ncbi:BTAD domain-containing putative transcriptional regulator [Streptomyces gamaensis]|uniref:BTAD domain-containing putative transcriptional regulator n=1 Tax=Streptomyces gamaensis TaxID=1763542 RepID=A0ABW0YQ08_9ACTN
MHIELLGPVRIRAQERSSDIRASKVRAMLATLALHAGRAVSHLELVDELWSGSPLGNPRNALQAQATRVRKVLEAHTPQHTTSVLRAVPHGYLLDISADAVDANRFLDHVSRGGTALPDDPREAARQLQTGLRLWRGPALFDAGDGLRCASAAALFEERRLTAWEDLVTARLLLGHEAQAIAELQELVARHPLHERFCELLMLALYRTGRQSEALERFRTTHRRLDEQLGIQPGAHLQRRHAEILAQDPALLLPSALWNGRREPVASTC